MEILYPSLELAHTYKSELQFSIPANKWDKGKEAEEIVKIVPVAYHILSWENVKVFSYKKPLDEIVYRLLKERRFLGRVPNELPINPSIVYPRDLNYYHRLHFTDFESSVQFLEDVHPYVEIPRELVNH